MHIPKKTKQEKQKLTLKQRLIKILAYVLIIGLAFYFVWAVFAHESSERKKAKQELARTCYETMYIATGYTLSYSIDVTYLIKTSATSVDTVIMSYQAKEKVDQYNQKKQIELTSYGKVGETEIYQRQILYLADGKLITETYDQVGELIQTEVTESFVSYDYNPMLAFSSLIIEKPGEFKINDEQTVISGSVSIKDLSTFLMYFPYSALFDGMETTKYYDDQVNRIKILTSNGYFTSAVIDIKPVAGSLVGPFYEEMGSSVEVDQYTITMYIDSWAQPEIQIPTVETEGEES